MWFLCLCLSSFYWFLSLMRSTWQICCVSVLFDPITITKMIFFFYVTLFFLFRRFDCLSESPMRTWKNSLVMFVIRTHHCDDRFSYWPNEMIVYYLVGNIVISFQVDYSFRQVFFSFFQHKLFICYLLLYFDFFWDNVCIRPIAVAIRSRQQTCSLHVESINRCPLQEGTAFSIGHGHTGGGVDVETAEEESLRFSRRAQCRTLRFVAW